MPRSRTSSASPARRSRATSTTCSPRPAHATAASWSATRSATAWPPDTLAGTSWSWSSNRSSRRNGNGCRKIGEDPGSGETFVHHRCFEQILHGCQLACSLFASVIVAVLAWVENGGKGLEGGLGDLGEHGDLASGLVP